MRCQVGLVKAGPSWCASPCRRGPKRSLSGCCEAPGLAPGRRLPASARQVPLARSSPRTARPTAPASTPTGSCRRTSAASASRGAPCTARRSSEAGLVCGDTPRCCGARSGSTSMGWLASVLAAVMLRRGVLDSSVALVICTTSGLVLVQACAFRSHGVSQRARTCMPNLPKPLHIGSCRAQAEMPPLVRLDMLHVRMQACFVCSGDFVVCSGYDSQVAHALCDDNDTSDAADGVGQDGSTRWWWPSRPTRFVSRRPAFSMRALSPEP